MESCMRIGRSCGSIPRIYSLRPDGSSRSTVWILVILHLLLRSWQDFAT